MWSKPVLIACLAMSLCLVPAAALPQEPEGHKSTTTTSSSVKHTTTKTTTSVKYTTTKTTTSSVKPKTTSSSTTHSTTRSSTASSTASSTSSGPCAIATGGPSCTYNIYCNSSYTGSQTAISFASSLDSCASYAWGQESGAFFYKPSLGACSLSNPGSPGNSSLIRSDPSVDDGTYAGITSLMACYAH